MVQPLDLCFQIDRKTRVAAFRSISIQKCKFLIIWFMNDNIFYIWIILNLTSRYIPLGQQSGYDSVIKSQIPFYSFFLYHSSFYRVELCYIQHKQWNEPPTWNIYKKNPETESDLSLDFLLNDTHKKTVLVIGEHVSHISPKLLELQIKWYHTLTVDIYSLNKYLVSILHSMNPSFRSFNRSAQCFSHVVEFLLYCLNNIDFPSLRTRELEKLRHFGFYVPYFIVENKTKNVMLSTAWSGILLSVWKTGLAC